MQRAGQKLARHLSEPHKETVEQVKQLYCPACEVQVLDMQDQAVDAREKTLDIKSLPAVTVNGQLADCCAGRAS